MFTARTNAIGSRAYDSGLRTHMLRVYNLMTAGLALSAVVAAAVAWTPLGAVFLAMGPHGLRVSGLGLAATLAPLAMLLIAVFASPANWSGRGTAAFYWVFVALQGIGLSTALLVYGGASAALALTATTASFAGLSIWGYTTGRDLGPVGSFCMMGLFGMIAVALLSALTGFHVSSAMFGVIGVIVFSGLVAWDTQKTRDAYYAYGSASSAQASYWSALNLYLDAINLFLSILRLVGDKD